MGVKSKWRGGGDPGPVVTKRGPRRVCRGGRREEHGLVVVARSPSVPSLLNLLPDPQRADQRYHLTFTC